MNNTIYHKKNYKIVQLQKDAYLIINTAKVFKDGHTHQNNYYICKVIIYCCTYGEFPKNAQHLKKNKRIMDSICRVCPKRYIRTFTYQ